MSCLLDFGCELCICDILTCQFLPGSVDCSSLLGSRIGIDVAVKDFGILKFHAPNLVGFAMLAAWI